MIIDTSVIVAILAREPEALGLLRTIRATKPRRLSAASYGEVGAVIDRSTDPVARTGLDNLLKRMQIEISPVTESQARIARQAFRDFGKGSGHRAGLSFGDCFAYALARELDEPLLYKGDDFSHTDLAFVGQPAERRRLSELRAAYGEERPAT